MTTYLLFRKVYVLWIFSAQFTVAITTENRIMPEIQQYYVKNCIHHVCLSVCCYQYGITQLLLDGFLWMFTQWGLLLKSVEKVWVCLTLDQNNRHFTWSTTYIYGCFVSNIMVALVTKVTSVAVDVTGQLVPWLPLLLMLPLTFWLPWLSWL